MEKIIIAPHPDDELIGCYKVLKAGQVKAVVYLFELTEARMKEARRVGQHFGFKPIFQNPLQRHTMTADEIYVPTFEDMHPQHKQALYWALDNAQGKLVYYTIDKTIPFDVLTPQERSEKRKLLDEFYSSQKLLWERDEKYILFEGYRLTDAIIWCEANTIFEGYHQWVDAPEKVKFLRDKHRHMFYVTVWIEQNHKERDLEFILLKWDLDNKLREWRATAGTKWSVETLADHLRTKYINQFHRRVKVRVMEDNENGATLE